MDILKKPSFFRPYTYIDEFMLIPGINIWRNIFHSLVRRCLPIVIPKQGDKGICMFVNHNYCPMIIVSLNSLFYQMRKTYPCTVVSDGTLTSKDVALLNHHFPGIKIFINDDVNQRIAKILAPYPNCLHFRKINHPHKFNRKLFDPFLLCSYKRIVYVDIDCLCINKPNFLLRWLNSINKNSGLFATEYEYKYVFLNNLSPEWHIIQNVIDHEFGLKTIRGFNSGFICIDRQNYSLQLIEKILTYFRQIGLWNTWAPEQLALNVIMSTINSVNVQDHFLHLTRYDILPIRNSYNYDLIHYAYQAKKYFYFYAVKMLLATQYFKESN